MNILRLRDLEPRMQRGTSKRIRWIRRSFTERRNVYPFDGLREPRLLNPQFRLQEWSLSASDDSSRQPSPSEKEARLNCKPHVFEQTCSTRWNPAFDAILKSGAAGGPSRLQKAIHRIREQDPDLSVKEILKRTAELRLTSWKSPWTEEAKSFVLDHAREFSVADIARRLGRTPGAVYQLLWKSGESAKFQDGYTQRELAQVLHVAPRKVRRWIRLGWLSIYQGRIKDRSLERFLKDHSDEIDAGRLEDDLRRWLQDLGLREGTSHSVRWLGVRKQSFNVHVCNRCGRKVRGNAIQRHVRACAKEARVAPNRAQKLELN